MIVLLYYFVFHMLEINEIGVNENIIVNNNDVSAVFACIEEQQEEQQEVLSSILLKNKLEQIETSLGYLLLSVKEINERIEQLILQWIIGGNLVVSWAGDFFLVAVDHILVAHG